AAAAVGQHSLEVQQLAQAQVLASGALGSSASVVGTGTLTLEIGTTVAGVFAPKSGNVAVPIVIDSSKQTLAGTRDAINASGAGVTASIVNGTGGSRLVLRGADGAANSIRLTAVDDDANNTNAAGLSQLAWDPAATAGTGANLSQTQGAKDAMFTVDGVALTSATNSPSDALDGVTLTLKQVTTKPVGIAVSVQTMALRKNINDFVSAYNSLNTLLLNDTKADPTGANRGPLQADSAAVTTLNSLRTMLRGAVSGMTGANSLNAAGIVLQRDGSLATDEKRLTTALQSPQKLSQLFAQTQTGTDASTAGFGARFKTWVTSMTGDAGALSTRVAGLKKGVDSNQKQQDTMNGRLAATEARLRRQYQTLDSQMTSINAQMAQMKASLGLT
ncbi:MAG: flagellar filament capping protein FliD, partial [Ramlibacter sp.]|nr:flagellar filament capping protein FliD [Ramlibacter sp.]